LKIEVEIPEWAYKNHILVLASNEPFLILKSFQDRWEVWKKRVRCNFCGKCCEIKDDPDWLYSSKWMVIDGEEKQMCGALRLEDGKYLCTAELDPWQCIFKNPPNKPHPECVIEYGLIQTIEK